MDGPIRQLAFCRPVSVGEGARDGVVTMVGISVGVAVGVGGFVGIVVGTGASVNVTARVAGEVGVSITGTTGGSLALAIRIYPLAMINIPTIIFFNRNLSALPGTDDLPLGVSGCF